jgi:hypothetical protein
VEAVDGKVDVADVVAESVGVVDTVLEPVDDCDDDALDDIVMLAEEVAVVLPELDTEEEAEDETVDVWVVGWHVSNGGAPKLPP